MILALVFLIFISVQQNDKMIEYLSLEASTPTSCGVTSQCTDSDGQAIECCDTNGQVGGTNQCCQMTDCSYRNC